MLLLLIGPQVLDPDRLEHAPVDGLRPVVLAVLLVTPEHVLDVFAVADIVLLEGGDVGGAQGVRGGQPWLRSDGRAAVIYLYWLILRNWRARVWLRLHRFLRYPISVDARADISRRYIFLFSLHKGHGLLHGARRLIRDVVLVMVRLKHFF